MLPKLYYQTDGKLSLLPEWAYFYANLGGQVASLSRNHSRTVVCLAIPTRAFAVAFTMTGAIASQTEQDTSIDESQIEYISGQQAGTSVRVRTNDGRLLRGVIVGFKEWGGKPNIIIRTTSNQEQWFKLDEYADRISISDTEINLPKNQQTGRQLELPSDFLQCILGIKIARNHVLESSFGAIAIGKLSLLGKELCNAQFHCISTEVESSKIGYLQDIARVRQFIGVNQAYKSQCISDSSSGPQKETGLQEPPIVIFDGACAYLKHSHNWKRSNHIVVLDRTERQFSEAANLVNQRYAYREKSVRNLKLTIPSQIEMMAYKERI